ncbi:preprotein translocase, SecE subunit domain protein [Companilactobacillus jidongensis]|uniref:preprotein translocase, SecE subunit domain protein n=1 Tax=Companilactobacillus jidongensis TaxID=2486006 RepID=UPI000F77A421|nr:preprotein translocase, SecE subunit domain protein [Companilactobacillus jidongensis]
MGHWEPGRVFQEMNWVEDDGGGCGCGCIIAILVIVALLFGISFILNHLGVIIIFGVLALVIFFAIKW